MSKHLKWLSCSILVLLSACLNLHAIQEYSCKLLIAYVEVGVPSSASRYRVNIIECKTSPSHWQASFLDLYATVNTCDSSSRILVNSGSVTVVVFADVLRNQQESATWWNFPVPQLAAEVAPPGALKIVMQGQTYSASEDVYLLDASASSITHLT